MWGHISYSYEDCTAFYNSLAYVNFDVSRVACLVFQQWPISNISAAEFPSDSPSSKRIT